MGKVLTEETECKSEDLSGTEVALELLLVPKTCKHGNVLLGLFINRCAGHLV